MVAHWSYLKYVLRHKWHVFVGCRRLGVPLWQSLVHDMSKFGWAEWGAYVNWFYRRSKNESDALAQRAAFDAAWNHHQKCNPHHWQYWLLIADTDNPRITALPIPQCYVLEMVADWYGAGMAIHGRNDLGSWHLNNKDRIILEDDTRYRVTQAIAKLQGATE